MVNEVSSKSRRLFMLGTNVFRCFQHPFSCADLHPERNIIVLGTETSKLLIYDTLSSFYITTITLKINTGVKAVRFSPGLFLSIDQIRSTDLLFSINGQMARIWQWVSRTAMFSSSTSSEMAIFIYAPMAYCEYTWSIDLDRGRSSFLCLSL